MSNLDAFEAEVRKNIKLLSSNDKNVRYKSAVWLGEAGDPSAITRLRQIYKDDPDKKVREAAAYSLGMFRALEEALDSDESEAVLDQLQAIAGEGVKVRRTRFRASTLAKLNLGLLVSLIMILGFNFVLWPQLRTQFGSAAAGTGNGEDAATDFSTYAANLSSNVAILQRQYQNVLGGGTIDCDVTFANLSPYDAGSVPDDLASSVTAANAALAEFNSAKEPFIQACPPNNTALTVADVGAPLGRLVPVVQSLSEIVLSVTDADSNPAAVPEQATEEAEAAEEVELPETVIEATPEVVFDASAHTTALSNIINSMVGTLGVNTSLTQYWSDTRANGTSGGCGQAIPTIPADYVLPEEDAALAGDQLNLAVSLVNNGLEFSRRSWTQFAEACRNNSLGSALETGTQTIQAATAAFQAAQTTLNALSGSQS